MKGYFLPLLTSTSGFIFAIYLIFKILKINKSGAEAKGVIKEIQSVNTSATKGYQCPVVQFITKKNECIIEASQIGYVYHTFKEGEKVTIIYDVNKPTNFFIKSLQTYVVISALLIISFVIIGVVLIS